VPLLHRFVQHSESVWQPPVEHCQFTHTCSPLRDSHFCCYLNFDRRYLQVAEKDAIGHRHAIGGLTAHRAVNVRHHLRRIVPPTVLGTTASSFGNHGVVPTGCSHGAGKVRGVVRVRNLTASGLVAAIENANAGDQLRTITHTHTTADQEGQTRLFSDVTDPCLMWPQSDDQSRCCTYRHSCLTKESCMYTGPDLHYYGDTLLHVTSQCR
jgi:hypothetical protein